MKTLPVVIDIKKICRLCFRDDDGHCKMTSIYEKPDLENTIRNCVQIEVLLDGNEPTNICESCMLSLNSWSKFKALCDNTNAFIQNYIQDNNEDNNEPVIDLISEIANLGTPHCTPPESSDFNIDFFDNDSQCKSMLQLQWSEEIESACTHLPTSNCTKKVLSDDLIFDSVSGEYMNMALNELSVKDNNATLPKTHCWNPKAISMKTIQKENEKPNFVKGKSMHRYNRYARKTFYCNFCPEKYTKFNELLVHDSTTHHDIPKKFICKDCGKLFLSKERLEIHEKVHREKLFQCQLCQKKFALQKSLDNHLNVHIGSYICKQCGYRAHSKKNLEVHESTHSVVKNHCCNECGKQFAILSSLRRHSRLVHQKSYLYCCDQCDYSTIHISSLKHHKANHTSQKFICDNCGSWFKTKALLTKHLKTHMDLQFKCTQCNKLFKKKETLKIHLNSCHKMGPVVKKYKCNKCEKYFVNSRNLRYHIAKHIL